MAVSAAKRNEAVENKTTPINDPFLRVAIVSP
jgi:hypothetical protein